MNLWFVIYNQNLAKHAVLDLGCHVHASFKGGLWKHGLVGIFTLPLMPCWEHASLVMHSHSHSFLVFLTPNLNHFL